MQRCEQRRLITGTGCNLQVCFVLCCARETDMPIVYASESFLGMTGYKPEEIIGRNCRSHACLLFCAPLLSGPFQLPLQTYAIHLCF